jgi:hypothetical protein
MATGIGIAQSTTSPAITLDYDFPGQVTPHFTLQIAEDGSGSYSVPKVTGAPSVMAFHLHAADVAGWFATARQLHFFQGKLDSSRKVAFTGTKTVTYSGADGHGTATIHYTENQRLQRLLSELEQLVETLQMGQTLQSDMRFRRLALDADIESFERSLKEQSASHPEVIAPILQQLADNPEVLERVSRQARAILKTVPAR